MWQHILIVGVGGALGSIARFLISKMVYDFRPHIFPFGTLLVNLSGCFLIGLFYAIATKSNFLSGNVRLFLTTGLCGGFTTFSAFAHENIVLLKLGFYAHSIIYTLASVILGIAATWIGIFLLK
jgi:fluoride exporter